MIILIMKITFFIVKQTNSAKQKLPVSSAFKYFDVHDIIFVEIT